jgi:hypothetical protein
MHPAAIRRAWDALPAWIKRPDFAMVFVAGALLRLLWLDSTSFLGDQAQLLALARLALVSGAPPLTGIRSSVGSMNPPASIYLLLPFAPLAPFWAVFAGALANVAGVALLYRIADRYAGRAAAFAAGLLYATAWGPVWYSRFLWQQNLLAPVLLLFFWALCRGVVDGRGGWLGWSVALWGIAVQLHPTAAPLLLLPVAGAVTAPATVSRRDVVAAALALGALFLPSALWELLTHGADLTRLGASAAGAFRIDGMAFQQLLALLQPASRDSLGQTSLYATAYAPLIVLSVLMALLALASTLWLLAVIVRPLVSPSRLPALAARWLPSAEVSDPGHTAGGRQRLAAALADPQWRFRVLLALWELAPLALMLRHSAPVYPHYVLVALPAGFLIAGMFLAWATRKVFTLVPTRFAIRFSATGAHSWRIAIGSSGLLAAAVLVLSLTQAYGTAAWMLAIERGAFDATAHGTRYGLPLETQRAALSHAGHVARSLGADLAVATDALHQEPLEYLATSVTRGAGVYDSDACLVVPAAGSRPLVTLALAPGAAGAWLPQLQGATPLEGPTSEDGISSRLVRIPPGAALPGEVALANPSSQTGLRLAGYFVDRSGDGGGHLLLHWTGTPQLPGDPTGGSHLFDGVATLPGSATVAHYWFLARPLDSVGNPLGAPLVAQCPRLAWGAGHDVYAAVTIPAPLATSAASWRVVVYGTPYVATHSSLGPLPLVAGDVHEVVGAPLDPGVVFPTR